MKKINLFCIIAFVVLINASCYQSDCQSKRMDEMNKSIYELNKTIDDLNHKILSLDEKLIKIEKNLYTKRYKARRNIVRKKFKNVKRKSEDLDKEDDEQAEE
jgi:hypothetical protein